MVILQTAVDKLKQDGLTMDKSVSLSPQRVCALTTFGFRVSFCSFEWSVRVPHLSWR